MGGLRSLIWSGTDGRRDVDERLVDGGNDFVVNNGSIHQIYDEQNNTNLIRTCLIFIVYSERIKRKISIAFHNE